MVGALCRRLITAGLDGTGFMAGFYGGALWWRFYGGGFTAGYGGGLMGRALWRGHCAMAMFFCLFDNHNHENKFVFRRLRYSTCRPPTHYIV